MQKPTNAKRGFTLVEVIVVLVVLAILAAIMIPAMTGWIARAKEKRAIVECRTCVLAAQTLASEKYGKDKANVSVSPAETLALAKVPGTVNGVDVDATAATVDSLTYTDTASTIVTYLRLPDPHYVFGGGGAYGSIPSVISAFQSVQKNGAGAAVEGGQKFNGTKIDGVNSQKTGTFANAMYQTFTPEQQAYLDTVSWSIVRDNPSSPYYLYFTTDKHYAATESGSDMKVYKYNLTTKQYQYTSTGTAVTKGEVKSSGTDWSTPSYSID